MPSFERFLEGKDPESTSFKALEIPVLPILKKCSAYKENSIETTHKLPALDPSCPSPTPKHHTGIQTYHVQLGNRVCESGDCRRQDGISGRRSESLRRGGPELKQRHKIETGCGIREILRAGYGMKISWRDRDALISIGGMRDSFQIVGRMRDLNSK